MLLGSPAVGELPHERGHVRPGMELGDQLVDLALRPVYRAAQDRVTVLAGEVRGQPGHTAQVEAAVGQHLEQDRVLAAGARRRDPQVSLGAREMQDPGAVREHRRRGEARVESSPVDLADVGDQIDLGAAGIAQELAQSAQQLVIRDCAEGECLCHEPRLTHTADRMGPV